jgi:CRISPR-associated endonuclease/helicase Cas3
VIVFDEAQMLPVPFLRPCLASICELVKNYRCSAVLCTATQPAVEGLLHEYTPNAQVRELCPEPEQMYQAFRRVSYIDDGELSDEELAERLRERHQVLCVVNSRRQAQALYHALGENEENFHLSTMMTPYDRRCLLLEIRARLHDGRTCRVISTSLIEAGVDVDFPEVYRAIAGLDSIIQSGGRCNREGKRTAKESLVHIFRTSAKAPRMLEQNISAAERILRTCQEADSPAAIHAYFEFLLYTLKDDRQLDEKGILDHVRNLRFKSAAEAFKLIDGADYTIYIPVGEGKDLIQKLRKDGPSRELLRKLGPYTVTVYRQYFAELCDNGMLETISGNAGILLNSELYSPETGLPFTISEQSQALFI